MKTPCLLFALVLLVLHIQAMPNPVGENDPQKEADTWDEVEDDAWEAEGDVEAAGASGENSPMICGFSGGSCRTVCLISEVMAGKCYGSYVCCVPR
uniref:Antimicrobial-peptide n=1 Tax=Alligator sinensis TaxID=38654 RepID=A0A2H4ZLE1_ALLSI|nr:antimicrobial-peptide [Alligator sinensis]